MPPQTYNKKTDVIKIGTTSLQSFKQGKSNQMLIACLVITHRHVYKDVIAVVGWVISEDVRIISRTITDDKAQSNKKTVYQKDRE